MGWFDDEDENHPFHNRPRGFFGFGSPFGAIFRGSEGSENDEYGGIFADFDRMMSDMEHMFRHIDDAFNHNHKHFPPLDNEERDESGHRFVFPNTPPMFGVPQNPRSLRDSMLKDPSEFSGQRPENIPAIQIPTHRKDQVPVLDGRIHRYDLGNIIRGGNSEISENSEIQPYTQPQRRSWFNFKSTSRVQRPDGMIEERTTTRDTRGREVTTITTPREGETHTLTTSRENLGVKGVTANTATTREGATHTVTTSRDNSDQTFIQPIQPTPVNVPFLEKKEDDNFLNDMQNPPPIDKEKSVIFSKLFGKYWYK